MTSWKQCDKDVYTLKYIPYLEDLRRGCMIHMLGGESWYGTRNEASGAAALQPKNARNCAVLKSAKIRETMRQTVR